MFRRLGAFVFAIALVSPLTAAAADSKTAGADGNTTATPTAGAPSKEEAAATARLLALAREPQRPRALMALYGTYATLQVMDIVSTRRAIGSGGQESNPLMGSGQTGQMIAMKALGSAASIYFSERIWKKNRVAAIVTMAAVNGVTAAVVAHNAQIRR